MDFLTDLVKSATGNNNSGSNSNTPKKGPSAFTPVRSKNNENNNSSSSSNSNNNNIINNNVLVASCTSTTPVKTPTGKPPKGNNNNNNNNTGPRICGTPRFGTPNSASKDDCITEKVFMVKYTPPHDDVGLYVVGSIGSLGGWVVSRGRQMELVGHGEWRLATYIPDNTSFNYKYLAVDKTTDQTIWESEMQDSLMNAGGDSANAAKAISPPAPAFSASPSDLTSEISKLQIERATKERIQWEKINSKGTAAALLNEEESSFGGVHNLIQELQVAMKSTVQTSRSSEFSRRNSISPVPPVANNPETLVKLNALEAEKEELLKEKSDLQQLYDGALRDSEKLRMEYMQQMAKMEEEIKVTSAEKAAVESSIRCLVEKIQEVRSEYGSLRQQVQSLSGETMPMIAQVSSSISDSVAVVASNVQKELDETLVKYQRESTQRKKLHNDLLDLKGAIRVFCRVRPMSRSELEAGTTACVVCQDENTVVLDGEKAFTFDHVFGPNSTQEAVFRETEALVVSVLDGYNVCIFAYGQTGSGKTYTMEGHPADPGVNIRALQALFTLADDRRGVWEYEIKVSVMEIYNETVRDLLGKEDAGKLDVKANGEAGGFVPGLTTTRVDCLKQVQDTMALAHKKRHTSATNMNEHSSRSHMVLTVYTSARNISNGARANGKMHLIDLAGNERVGKSGAVGERLVEATNINMSLLSLGDVIAALCKKSSHVPYRNSKLTFFLQDSLGGQSKILMFTNISPSSLNTSETKCSLLFGTKARSVELGPAKKNAGDVKSAILIREKDVELENLRQKLKMVEEQALLVPKLQETISNLSNEQRAAKDNASSKDWAINDLEKRLNDQELANQSLRDDIARLQEENRRLATQAPTIVRVAAPAPAPAPTPTPTATTNSNVSTTAGHKRPHIAFKDEEDARQQQCDYEADACSQSESESDNHRVFSKTAPSGSSVLAECISQYRLKNSEIVPVRNENSDPNFGGIKRHYAVDDMTPRKKATSNQSRPLTAPATVARLNSSTLRSRIGGLGGPAERVSRNKELTKAPKTKRLTQSVSNSNCGASSASSSAWR